MPVYEYECGSCGHTTEAIRRMADANTPQPCEKCGRAETTRKHSLFSAAASGPGSTTTSWGGGGHVHRGACGCGKRAGSCGMG